MNWPVLIIVGVILIALVIFLVVRNQKDEELVEKQLNDDFHKTKMADPDVDLDSKLK